MRQPRILTTISLLLSLPYTTLCDTQSAVSLASFTPSVNPSTLSPSCRAVYMSTISGCTVADFTPPNDCSALCITSLITLDVSVIKDCFVDKVDPNSILGYFQRGTGIQALCDIAVVTASGTSHMSTVSVTDQQSSVGPKSTIFISPVSVPTSSVVSMQPNSTPQSTISISVVTPATTSSTMKTSSSISTPTVQQANQNPSKPTCTGKLGQGNMGSPFDAFTDQLCSEGWKLKGNLGWSILGTIVMGLGMLR